MKIRSIRSWECWFWFINSLRSPMITKKSRTRIATQLPNAKSSHMSFPDFGNKKSLKKQTCSILSSLANQNIPAFLTDISLNIDIFKCNSPNVLILVSLHRRSLCWIFWECLKSFSYWHTSLSLCFLQTEILIIATSPRLWGPLTLLGPGAYGH